MVDATGLGVDELAAGFATVGIRPAQTILVHSALRTLGPVQGGAATVVDALLRVIGPRGTLVAPAFTFIHEVEDEPIIDPAADRSEMGAISEAVRRHPDARRTTGYRHSFSAIGHRADVLAGVDPALSAYDLRSSFGVMLALNTQVVLLGVTYANSTSHHFAEWLSDVPYRHVVPRKVRVRMPDGSLRDQAMTDYQPKPSGDGTYYGPRGSEFNHLGRMLEERGMVGVGTVGNAMVRRFAMQDLVTLAQDEAAVDHNIFRTPEGRTDHITQLPEGVFVIGDPTLDGAGRPEHRLWSVADPERMVGWRPDWEVRRP